LRLISPIPKIRRRAKYSPKIPYQSIKTVINLPCCEEQNRTEQLISQRLGFFVVTAYRERRQTMERWLEHLVIMQLRLTHRVMTAHLHYIKS